jgi:hypothetical protein
LIAAGVADPEWFDLGDTRQRSGTDANGDRYAIQRRGRGVWLLHLRQQDELSAKSSPEAEAITAAMLSTL